MGMRKTWRPMTSISVSMTLMALRGSSIRSRLVPTCKLLPICCCHILYSLANHSPSNCLFPERMTHVASTAGKRNRALATSSLDQPGERTPTTSSGWRRCACLAVRTRSAARTPSLGWCQASRRAAAHPAIPVAGARYGGHVRLAKTIEARDDLLYADLLQIRDELVKLLGVLFGNCALPKEMIQSHS